MDKGIRITSDQAERFIFLRRKREALDLVQHYGMAYHVRFAGRNVAEMTTVQMFNARKFLSSRPKDVLKATWIDILTREAVCRGVERGSEYSL